MLSFHVYIHRYSGWCVSLEVQSITEFEIPSVARKTEGEYIKTMAGWASAIVSTLTWSGFENITWWAEGDQQFGENHSRCYTNLTLVSQLRLTMKINIDWCRPRPSCQVSAVTWDQPFLEWVPGYEASTGHIVNTYPMEDWDNVIMNVKVIYPVNIVNILHASPNAAHSYTTWLLGQSPKQCIIPKYGIILSVNFPQPLVHTKYHMLQAPAQTHQRVSATEHTVLVQDWSHAGTCRLDAENSPTTHSATLTGTVEFGIIHDDENSFLDSHWWAWLHWRENTPIHPVPWHFYSWYMELRFIPCKNYYQNIVGFTCRTHCYWPGLISCRAAFFLHLVATARRLVLGAPAGKLCLLTLRVPFRKSNVHGASKSSWCYKRWEFTSGLSLDQPLPEKVRGKLQWYTGHVVNSVQ